MSDDASGRLGVSRFQIRQDRDGQYRWSLFNASGTMVGTHPEGFASAREARLDAEQLRDQLASAPIVGAADEGTSPSL